MGYHSDILEAKVDGGQQMAVQVDHHAAPKAAEPAYGISDDEVRAFLDGRVTGPLTADFIDEIRDHMAMRQFADRIEIIRRSDEAMRDAIAAMRAGGLDEVADKLEDIRLSDRAKEVAASSEKLTAGAGVAAAFQRWTVAIMASHHAAPCPDEVMEALVKAESDAEVALMGVPATSADDVLMKLWPLLVALDEPRRGQPPMCPESISDDDIGFWHALRADIEQHCPMIAKAMGRPTSDREVAKAAARPGGHVVDPHSAWLAEWLQLRTKSRTLDLSDGDANTIDDKALALEGQIIATPAQTLVGNQARMTIVCSAAAWDGACYPEEIARPIMDEAIALGIGRAA